GLEDLPVDSRITTSVNLAEISQVFPLDSLQLGGILDLDATVQGKYAPEKKLFPVSNVRIKLKDGSLLTRYYPQPLEQINLDLLVTNKNGKISGTSVKVEDLSFLFEKNPFHLKASLNNPDNLLYDVTAKGNIDLAGIYKMFSQEGMELSGSLTADLHLKGSQKDAMEGRIDRLNNKGTLGLKNIAFRSQYLPHDLILKKGSFRFDNDKIWFEHFDSRCGSSAIMLDGNLGNVVNYFLGKKQVLRGNLNFTSAFVDIRDFMTESSPAGSTTPATSSPGVIIIPPEFDINLKADLRKVKFESNFLDSLTANIQVDTGMIVLKNMQFSMIGCRVNMDASYASTSARKAFFEFHVKAENFDVQRAYREIEMFRNLASSAEKCEGIISIDYQLKGRLINDMEPVYPSLEGNGVITLAKVKVMGLRLFTDMSKNLGREKLKSPDLSKVELKTTIRNNIITLEQTKMKISGFRLKISGESSFDGKLNLKTRVGLPPLGILGIPIRILGTSDNPKFKYGRGNNDEQLEESQYSDELPAEFMDRLKNVKEEEDDGTDR
ncbi:MAG: AsmA-like C-terminal region-containing protein, partial [Syntrophothermus sp.]